MINLKRKLALLLGNNLNLSFFTFQPVAGVQSLLNTSTLNTAG